MASPSLGSHHPGILVDASLAAMCKKAPIRGATYRKDAEHLA
jgi:hypothetical protein